LTGFEDTTNGFIADADANGCYEFQGQYGEKGYYYNNNYYMWFGVGSWYVDQTLGVISPAYSLDVVFGGPPYRPVGTAWNDINTVLNGVTQSVEGCP